MLNDAGGCYKTSHCTQSRRPSPPGVSENFGHASTLASVCPKTFPPPHCPNNFLFDSCYTETYESVTTRDNRARPIGFPDPNGAAGLVGAAAGRPPSSGPLPPAHWPTSPPGPTPPPCGKTDPPQLPDTTSQPGPHDM